MKKLTLRVLPFVALLVASTGAFAASTPAAAPAGGIKIAVVDLQQVLQQAPQMTAANAQLKKQFEPQEQQIIAAQKKLKTDSDKLQQGATSLSKDEAAKLQQTVVTDKSQLEQQFITFRQNLIAAHNKAMQAVIDQVNTTIATIAKQGQYNIVLQKQGILYADQGYDITGQVVTALKSAK